MRLYSPTIFCEGVFVYMALLTGNCKDFVFMVDFSGNSHILAGKTKFKRSKDFMKRNKTRAMVECALMIALGTVLAQIKIWQMPYGGSVSCCSMMPILLLAALLGNRASMFGGLVLGCLSIVNGAYVIHPIQSFKDILVVVLGCGDFTKAILCSCLYV